MLRRAATGIDIDGMRSTRHVLHVDRLIVWLVYLKLGFQSSGLYEIDKKEMIVIPKAAARKPLPPEIPQQYSDDYKEACLVLGDSPKASAALSRRCLQNLIHDVSNIRLRNLNDEIEALITKGALPSFINEQLHAVRVIGNFAAHPLKSTSSGEIIDVEPGEAEWTLDVLDSLFDFYFIQPAVAQKRKEQINQKLSSAGKPTI